MIDNDSLRQALGSLERHAPAEADVLAGVYQGIHRRRRRRQVASVAVVAGAASLVALGVMVAAPGQGTDQGGSPQAVAPGSASTPVVAAPPAPELPFTAGWVPRGYSLDAWEVGDGTSSAQYTGTRDFQTVVVWVSDQPRDDAPDAVDEPATVAGRQGTIRRLGGGPDTQLVWQLPDGRWAMVGGRVPTVSLDALHRVAENLTGRPTSLEVDLQLRGLPAGYQVAGWSGGVESGAVTLCRGAADLREERPADCITVSVETGKAPATVAGPLVLKDGATKTPVQVPVDQKELVDGVATRATADGVLALAQVDAGHWARAFSQEAGDDVLRQTVVLVSVR